MRFARPPLQPFVARIPAWLWRPSPPCRTVRGNHDLALRKDSDHHRLRRRHRQRHGALFAELGRPPSLPVIAMHLVGQTATVGAASAMRSIDRRDTTDEQAVRPA